MHLEKEISKSVSFNCFETSEEDKREQEILEATSVPVFMTNELAIQLIREAVQMDDHTKLYTLLIQNYQKLFDEIFDKSNIVAFKTLMTLPVLNTLIDVFHNIKIEFPYKTYCNKLCYDYLKQKDNRDSNIEDILFKISREVNRDIIPDLLSIYIPEDLAAHLALAKYSSTEDLVNIKRMNRVIIHSDKEFMTEQKIIDIYSKLFRQVTKLFEGIMFDVLTDFWSDEEEYLYSTVDLAILDIMESMTLDDIKGVLRSYISDRKLIFNDHKVRFNIKAISQGDYSRILQAIDYLEASEGLYFY